MIWQLNCSLAKSLTTVLQRQDSPRELSVRYFLIEPKKEKLFKTIFYTSTKNIKTFHFVVIPYLKVAVGGGYWDGSL